MKAKIILFSIVFLLSSFYSFSQNQQNHSIKYDITAKNISLDAIGSYPQKLINNSTCDTCFHVQITSFNTYTDTSRINCIKQDILNPAYVYDSDIAQYLEATALINPKLKDIQIISDTLFKGVDNTWEIIDKGLKFTSKHLKFDDSLAIEIGEGRSSTLDVQTILNRQKGTCSEYTNVFIALMRNKGIPCRFVTGYIYFPEQNFEGEHAWAECYIKGCGWWPVDPQNAMNFTPKAFIKLFYGKDFVDCKINVLPDMSPVNVKIIN